MSELEEQNPQIENFSRGDSAATEGFDFNFDEVFDSMETLALNNNDAQVPFVGPQGNQGQAPVEQGPSVWPESQYQQLAAQDEPPQWIPPNELAEQEQLSNEAAATSTVSTTQPAVATQSIDPPAQENDEVEPELPNYSQPATIQWTPQQFEQFEQFEQPVNVNEMETTAPAPRLQPDESVDVDETEQWGSELNTADRSLGASAVVETVSVNETEQWGSEADEYQSLAYYGGNDDYTPASYVAPIQPVTQEVTPTDETEQWGSVDRSLGASAVVETVSVNETEQWGSEADEYQLLAYYGGNDDYTPASYVTPVTPVTSTTQTSTVQADYSPYTDETEQWGSEADEYQSLLYYGNNDDYAPALPAGPVYSTPQAPAVQADDDNYYGSEMDEYLSLLSYGDNGNNDDYNPASYVAPVHTTTQTPAVQADADNYYGSEMDEYLSLQSYQSEQHNDSVPANSTAQAPRLQADEIDEYAPPQTYSYDEMPEQASVDAVAPTAPQVQIVEVHDDPQPELVEMPVEQLVVHIPAEPQQVTVHPAEEIVEEQVPHEPVVVAVSAPPVEVQVPTEPVVVPAAVQPEQRVEQLAAPGLQLVQPLQPVTTQTPVLPLSQPAQLEMAQTPAVHLTAPVPGLHSVSLINERGHEMPQFVSTQMTLTHVAPTVDHTNDRDRDAGAPPQPRDRHQSVPVGIPGGGLGSMPLGLMFSSTTTRRNQTDRTPQAEQDPRRTPQRQGADRTNPVMSEAMNLLGRLRETIDAWAATRPAPGATPTTPSLREIIAQSRQEREAAIARRMMLPVGSAARLDGMLLSRRLVGPGSAATLDGKPQFFRSNARMRQVRRLIGAEIALCIMLSASAIARDNQIKQVQTSPNQRLKPGHSNNDLYAAAAPQQRPTYKVSEGDTLVRLAENRYGDPDVAWLIAELNQCRTSQSDEDGNLIVCVMEGTALELPVWSDLRDFYQDENHRCRTTVGEVITLIEQNALHQEAIASLAPAMGASAAI